MNGRTLVVAVKVFSGNVLLSAILNQDEKG